MGLLFEGVKNAKISGSEKSDTHNWNEGPFIDAAEPLLDEGLPQASIYSFAIWAQLRTQLIPAVLQWIE